MTELSLTHGVHRERLRRVADMLTVAMAVMLPWSTSATAIFVILWLLALVPSLDWRDFRAEVTTAAGGLPVLLVALGVAGMLWADVSLVERWRGVDSFLKLLTIPLLLTQFRRSGQGHCVFAGFLTSCVVLMVVSGFVQLFHPFGLTLHRPPNSVLVRNAPSQSDEFVACIFGLLYLAHAAADQRRWWRLLAFAAVIFAMLANTLFVATGRTALVVAAVLLALFAARKRDIRTGVILACAAAFTAAAWISSPYLRDRTKLFFHDLERYAAADTVTSAGERLVFWTKSIEFMRQAPLVGHGTGSIRALFEKSAVGQSGAAGEVAANPHNQTLAVGIQLGLLGIAVLWAMWLAHLVWFRGGGLAEWVGLVVVVQNVVGSLFNSHLFDFSQGWTYAIGVGVAGGMVLKAVHANENAVHAKGKTSAAQQ